MYSFAQRSDTVVLDEPFYAIYLLKSGAHHPGREEVINTLPNSENEVLQLIRSQQAKDVTFIKNMAHHCEVLECLTLEDAINVFLIRNPHQIIASYAEVIETPVMRDIGIAYQYHLFNELQKSGKAPVVLDTGLLLEDPRTVLGKLCTACALPFEEQMLHWPAGPKPYDGVWATHWYANVHSSTGFKKQNSSSRSLPERLKTLYQEAMVYYQKLLPFSLKA
jgi:hypothetical protein